METPIAMMYRAAKTDIPAEAAHVARIANHLQSCLSVMDVQSAHAGEPAVLTSMLHVGGDMLSVLGRAVTSMDNCSVALILTANDYVATDDQARADYDALSSTLRDAPTETHPTASLPNPEAPGADVPLPSGPYPPGQTGHVDPNEAPVDPEQEREDRGDGGDDQPGIPEIDRDWD